MERPDQSIGIEDCQRVSQDLSAILDVEDSLDNAYTLEVSSPGLERPLRGPADYERFAGRAAKIVVREAVEGDAVVLEAGKRKKVRLPFDNIARGRLAVEF